MRVPRRRHLWPLIGLGGAEQSTPAKIRTGNVEQELEAKFKSAQAKATKVAVENLTKEDINGLSSAQLKELRGY